MLGIALALEEADRSDFYMLLAGGRRCGELLDVCDGQLAAVLRVEAETGLVPAAILDLEEKYDL